MHDGERGGCGVDRDRVVQYCSKHFAISSSVISLICPVKFYTVLQGKFEWSLLVMCGIVILFRFEFCSDFGKKL